MSHSYKPAQVIDELFEGALAQTFNETGVDKALHTPHFILARFVNGCLKAFNVATNRRDEWWGFVPEIGNPHVIGSTIKSTEPSWFKNCITVREVIEEFCKMVPDFPLMTEGSVTAVQNAAINRIADFYG